MDDQVITSTGADQNKEVVTTTDTTTSTATITQPRRSQRLNENHKGQAATPHVGTRLPRTPRPIDPVQRRKKAWPYKWETWRIESVATQLSMSDPDAVERLRTTKLDDLWKSDPQQASIYEDALLVYDERARAAQSNAVASPEAEPSSQNINMVASETEAPNSAVSAPETHITFEGRPVASADLGAALTLMSLRYGGNTQDYINYGASESSMGLQAFTSVNAPKVTTSKSMTLDGIPETPVLNVISERSPSPIHIPQASDVPGISTRRKGKQPVTYPLSTHGHSNGAGLRVPAANESQTQALATSPENDGTFDSNLKLPNNISKALSTVSRVVKPPTRSSKPTSNVTPVTLKQRSSRTSIIKKDVNKTLEPPTTLRRSKRKITHDSGNEDDVIDLTGHGRPASSKKLKAGYKKEKTAEESPMLLRSKRKVIRIDEDENDDNSSPEEAITKSNMAPDGEITQQRTLRRRSTRRIVHDSDDEAETFSTNIKNTVGSKNVKSEEVEKSPVLRRTKRKLIRIDEDEDADFSLLDDDLPTPKRSKKAVKKAKSTPVDEDFDDSSPEDGRPTPKNSKKAIDKPKKTSTDENEDDEDDDEDEEEVAPVKKLKQATKKATSTLIHPPANLPLKAPANTPGIPDGALALNEHFKKDTPRPLGVQLPINRTRTRWEWIPYNTRKVANANFDWADDQQRKDANRFRQQRIRRRLTEHGYIHDGRKNH